MFTGIIEQTGEVLKNENGKLAIAVPSSFARGMKVGSSVAVNGACLTNVKCQPRKLSGSNVKYLLCFDVVPETLRRTNLGALKRGGKVNLERALKANGRFEGHIVQGHVDAIAQIQNAKFKMQNNGKDILLYIQIPKGLEKYIVPKGSIAVDGISLTVVDTAPGYFTVAIIPHTLENTIAPFYKKGSVVNIEADILAKYVHKR